MLLAALGLLAVAPWVTARESSAMLDGTALELDMAGSLRFRLLELERRAEGAPSDDTRTFEQQLAEQRSLLLLLTRGDSTRHVPACPTAELCQRLAEHLARWDEHLGPGLRAARDAGALPQQLLADVGVEVGRLDETVHLLSAAIQAQAEGARRVGTWVTLAALLLVGLVGYGVWDVFGRIRRVRDAASERAEDVLVAEAGGGNEIGQLSRALALAARDAREHRRRDLRRLLELSEQQLAVRRAASALGDWIARRGTMEPVLAQVASVAGYASAVIEPAGSTSEEAENEFRLELVHAGGDLGTLVLKDRQRQAVSSEEQAVLLDTLGQILTIALVASRTLETGAVRGELSATLASAASVQGCAGPIGSAIRRLIDHDEAFVELLDVNGQVEEQIVVSPSASGRPVGDSAPPVEIVEVRPLPGGGEELIVRLGVDDSTVGTLHLLRQNARFSDSDRDRARDVASTLASAVARMELAARLRASQQWQTLGAFGRLLAHEIRNPLNSLSLQLQLLQRSTMRPDDRERLASRLESARQEIDRLDALVSDYLELHQVSGRLTFAQVDVDGVVAEVLTEQRELLEQSHTRVDVDLTPVSIEADGAKLHALLVNLIHNAVEAMQASEGERRLIVRLTADDERVTLTVADTGPGLEQPREIFLPGYSKKPGGTGMGLAICRQIAEGHGGRLRAANSPQGGAVLKLELPVRRSAET